MKEIEIKVSGMMCGGCENRVQNALKSVEGVENVVANHETGIVKITANSAVEESVLKERIEDIGFEVKGN